MLNYEVLLLMAKRTPKYILKIELDNTEAH